jgi:hypothetical protein
MSHVQVPHEVRNLVVRVREKMFVNLEFCTT